MTKYVLNSGAVGDNPEKARSFFAEISDGLGDNPKLLIGFFAQKREDWESGFEVISERVKSYAPEGVTPELALAFPDSFQDQMKSSDAIYLPGGDDHLCQYWLRQLNVPKVWDGKVVGTNSATSHAMSKHFWTCDWRKCMDGLGILDIKFLAHFNSDFGASDPRGPIDWQKAHDELSGYGDSSLPIHALAEGDYIVIEQ